MRYLFRGTSFAAAILLALCGSAGAIFETRDARLQAVKTVGIISAVGDQFTFAMGGLTGPDHGGRSLPIPSWRLDDLIVRQASAALSARFQVQPVTYNRAAFAAIKESPIKPVAIVGGDPIKKLVETEVTPQGLDAYIVITKARANVGGGNRKIEGVGLITYATVIESYSFVYALYEIRVIDGKTFEVIEKMTAGPLDDATEVRLGGPSRPADESFLHNGDSGPDESLHGAIVDLITRSLPTTLSDMHLTTIR
jgi:hypothetical protein